jgi:hypothetical protein
MSRISTLTPVCEIPIGFYFPMQDRRLNWALIKQEMIVNQTDVEILKNLKSQKLVVIGNYSTADEHKIRFTGYVYAY